MIYLNGQFNLATEANFGDKSVTHRALILSAISDGVCQISNACVCDDTMATANCLRALGAKIDVCGTTVTVTPLVSPKSGVTLDCKNSATTARLLAGLACGLGVAARFVGDASLSQRPMDRVVSPLAEMGGKIRLERDCLFVVEEGSRLCGKEMHLSLPSAQVKSALLIAALFAEGRTTVYQSQTRDHTEKMLAAMGADVEIAEGHVSVGKSRLAATNFCVPNDLSTAAFLLALGALKGGAQLKNVGVNPTRSGFLNALEGCGAHVEQTNERETNGEKTCDLKVVQTRITPIFLPRDAVAATIDEIPLLATLALFAEGTSKFCGVGELRYKESDRVKAVVETAQNCGQTAFFDGNDLTVVSNGKPNIRGVLRSHGDHRIAMSQAVLCLALGGGKIDDVSCVSVSCPQFFRLAGVPLKRFALVGDGVDGSLSPSLATDFAKDVGMSASYDLVDVKNATDEQLLAVCGSFDGANVTSPYKGRVAALFGQSFPVNTVCGGVAVSTDGVGALAALQRIDVNVRGKKLLFVGAGDAADSVAQTFTANGAQVFFVNRTQQKADILNAKYGGKDFGDDFDGVLSFVPPCEFEKNVRLPQKAEFVFSAEYKKASFLLEKGKAKNLKTTNGLAMLFFQGRESFRLWTGATPKLTFEEFEKAVER